MSKPPLTEVHIICDVGWIHRGYEQHLREFENIPPAEQFLIPKVLLEVELKYTKFRLQVFPQTFNNV